MSIHRIGLEPQFLLGGSGHPAISSSSPLSRLNYFDGKFLRAADLTAEQNYFRKLIAFSNQSGEAGVVYGFDTTRTGETLHLGAGLAVDPAGRVLYLPDDIDVEIGRLIEESSRTEARIHRAAATAKKNGAPAVFRDCEPVSESPPGGLTAGLDLWVIAIAYAEALCGEEDVYGKLCEEACATETDRPRRVDGIVVRARKLTLHTALPTSKAVALGTVHLRSRVASAYFADEALEVGSLISASGLALETWCLGADAAGGTDVPVAVIARAGSHTVFLDAWTVRRERIEAPPRRYWAWRMAMRPWDVFLAQVLQFQCQLHELALGGPGGIVDDPCKPQHAALAEASEYLARVEEQFGRAGGTAPVEGDLRVEELRAYEAQPRELLPGGAAGISDLRRRLAGALKTLPTLTDRILIRGGIVELPSAGYLPVDVGRLTVNEQVRRLMGEGVDLRFCIVRSDYVAHALEEAQHMERISLLYGLDHPDQKPQVDIYVPDGELDKSTQTATGLGWDIQADLGPRFTDELQPVGRRHVLEYYDFANVSETNQAFSVHAAGRTDRLPGGGGSVCLAGVAPVGKELDPGLWVRGREEMSYETMASTAGEVGAPTADRREFISDVIGLAADAADHNVTRMAAEDPSMMEVATPRETWEVSDPNRDKTALAIWASASCERNPFELSVGDVTSFSATVDEVIAFGTASAWRLKVWGNLQVVRTRTVSATSKEIVARLTGAGSTGEFDGLATATLDTNQGVSQVTVQLQRGRSLGPQAHVMWGGDPLHAVLTIDLPTGESPSVEEGRMLEVESLRPRTIRLVLARGTQSDDVINPSNQAHVLAVSALQMIATIEEPGFLEAATKQLFPPPAEQTETLTVHARRDWVLFQRRRTASCGTEAPRPVGLPDRTYSVFAGQVSKKDLPRIREALIKGDAAVLARFGLRHVDEVEFAGGQPTLETSAAAFRTDWQTVSPGQSLVAWAGIASVSAEDGPDLARARLSTLMQALPPAATFPTGFVSEVLPVIPGTMALPGIDGVIIALTLADRQVTTCHEVFLLRDYLHAFDPGDLQPQEVLDQLGGMGPSDLGKVTFTNGQATASELAEVVRAYEHFSAGNGNPPLKVVYVASLDGTQSDEQPNAETICQALPVATPPIVVLSNLPAGVSFPREFQAECPTITLLGPNYERQ